MTVAKTSAEAPVTYYPMTPAEVVSMRALKLPPAAQDLLMLIKSLAPFGKKRFFNETFNERSIREELEMDRWTFRRAKKMLLERQLIEFNSYYLMDLRTVDRSQFKRKDESPSAEKSQEVPLSEPFLLPIKGAGLHPTEQPCTDRSLEPFNVSAFKPPKNDIKTGFNSYIRSTTEQPSTHPVVDQSPKANSEPNPLEGTEAASVPISATLSSRAEVSKLKPKTSGQVRYSAEPFLRFEKTLQSMGVRLNQNLLKEFSQAGVEKVERAIQYVKERVERAGIGKIPSVAGYIVKALRNFDDWGLSNSVSEIEWYKLSQWLKLADITELVQSTLVEEETSECIVCFYDESKLPWREAMEKYPNPLSFVHPKRAEAVPMPQNVKEQVRIALNAARRNFLKS